MQARIAGKGARIKIFVGSLAPGDEGRLVVIVLSSPCSQRYLVSPSEVWQVVIHSVHRYSSNEEIAIIPGVHYKPVDSVESVI